MSNALDSSGPVDADLGDLNGVGHGGSDPLDTFDFDDIFAQDATLSQRLDRSVDLIQVSDQGRKAEFSYNADEHQRRFIDSPARTIRLLAPAGSGKMRSIVNRVLVRVADGEPIQGFLILTFDEEVPPVQIVERIRTNFRSMSGLVGNLKEALNNDMPLGEFVDIASRFRGTTAQFHEMLGELLGKVEGGLFHPEEGDAVNLVTNFRAKGRQWHTVIFPGANQ